MDNTTRRLMMGAAGAVSPTYIEDVFSTWLYTGNGSTQTITNGIDLSGKGGMVWIKGRNGTAPDHLLFDTNRGATNYLVTNSTDSSISSATTLSSFASSGFSVGSYVYVNGFGSNPPFPDSFASWTFRKQAKFFDVVTWTGTGTTLNVAHNLGSAPGVIIAKRTNSTGDWWVYHRSLASSSSYLLLNTTNAVATGGPFQTGTPTSSSFSVEGGSVLNQSGQTYVAYLFAHDAGGFGDSGSDSVVKCGSFSTDASGLATVNLGWEPQWILFKATNEGTQNWRIFDTMRGWTANTANNAAGLDPNVSDAESTRSQLQLLSTGFYSFNLEASKTYIYIAIRRGPMKTPTDATKVFSASNVTASAAGTVVSTNFALDMQLWKWKSTAGDNKVVDRIRGASTRNASAINSPALYTNSTSAEVSNDTNSRGWDNLGFAVPSGAGFTDTIFYNFRRAPGFFDVVAYTGTGSARTINHNLGVVPELLIVKSRSSGVSNRGWFTYVPLVHTTNQYLELQRDIQTISSTGIWYTGVTSSVFAVNTDVVTNNSSETYIAYLFASCPGVSKVGSYTGTGTTLQVNCGFTNGARFVMIKRTDSTGDWYVWDSARGIVAGNDPYLLLNSTAAEVTNTDYVDTYSAGFEISSTAPAAINANGGSFIFLAVS